MYLNIHTYIHIYIYIHIHTHIYIYIYIYMCPASGAGCRILAVGLSYKGHTDLPVVRPVVASSWRSVLCRVSCVCIEYAGTG